MTEGNKIQPSEGLLESPVFKSFTQEDVDIVKPWWDYRTLRQKNKDWD